MSIKDWVKFIALGLIWGSSFLWIKIAVQEVTPLVLVTIRVFFALCALLVYAWIIKKHPFSFKRWWVFLVLGVFNVALPIVLIAWSEQYISSGMASILNSTVPLFTIIISPFFVPEDKLTLPRLSGLLMGFAGVVILMSNQVNGDLVGVKLGQLTMLVAALSYAASAVFARRQTNGLKVEDQSIGQMLMALLVLIPITFVVDSPVRLPALPLTWLALLMLGVLGPCMGTLLYFSLIHSVGPTRTVLTTYFFPLVGVILGVLFLNETPTWNMLAGGAMILSGIGLVNYKWRKSSDERSAVNV